MFELASQTLNQTKLEKLIDIWVSVAPCPEILCCEGSQKFSEALWVAASVHSYSNFPSVAQIVPPYNSGGAQFAC